MPQAADPPATLIPVSEAAKIAGVSYVHIGRRIRSGEVEAVRVGDHGPIRIDRLWFNQWLYGENAVANPGGVAEAQPSRSSGAPKAS